MKLEDIKILLVEDEKNARSTIRAMLSEMGINQVFESKTGEEAQVFLDMDAVEVDMVISDWNMPDKTGYQLLEYLRETHRTIPFIMITGRADQNSVKDAISAGVTSYIRKPFSMQDLESKVTFLHKKFFGG